MDENLVIAHLCKHLESKNWTICQKVAAGSRGIDVVALSPEGVRFQIEAKGGTSSREESPRFGKPYTKSQVFDVCSKGLMQCLHNLANKKQGDRIGFAYPRARYFSDYMDPIAGVIASIGMTTFVVEPDGRVTECHPD